MSVFEAMKYLKNVFNAQIDRLAAIEIDPYTFWGIKCSMGRGIILPGGKLEKDECALRGNGI